jgi:hypothetical protein
VAGGCTGSLRSRGMSVVLVASAHQGLLDSRLDIAFRLATNRRQLGDYEIMRAFEHALFTERKRLEVAQVG